MSLKDSVSVLPKDKYDELVNGAGDAEHCAEVLSDYVLELEAENANLKKSIRTYKFAIYDENSIEKLKAEGIREAATMCCPASGYVVRDEQARKDLLEYADFIEKQLPINLIENVND